ALHLALTVLCWSAYAFCTYMVERLRVSSPCNASWELMIGDDRMRWCSQCNLNVYNVSALTKHEISQLIREKEGSRLCARLYRRPDGTMMTSSCGQGGKPVVRHASRLVAAALAALMGTGVVSSQTSEPTSLVQISEAQSGIDVKVLDANGGPIQGASVSVRSGILKVPISGTTNEKGEWQFRGLEAA